MSMMMSTVLVNALNFENWNKDQVADWLRGEFILCLRMHVKSIYLYPTHC